MSETNKTELKNTLKTVEAAIVAQGTLVRKIRAVASAVNLINESMSELGPQVDILIEKLKELHEQASKMQPE